MTRRIHFLLRDPRHYQIAVLSSLLAYGVFVLDFDVRPLNALVLFATALVTQAIGSYATGLDRIDLRSPWISSLSLCLLFRTGNPAWAAVAAFASIGSKFVFRSRGKHIFNPTNLGIVVCLLLSDDAWVSPAQWGSGLTFAFFMACAGGVVVNRAARADITLAFLGSYAAILFGRALWLGQRWAVPLHQLESGALVLFAFFMISDPKTTPDRRAGRILFAVLVALGAATVQFVLYRTNGLLWSLAVLSPLVPLIDRLLPADRYAWPGETTRRPETSLPEVNVAPSFHPVPSLGGER